ncbi:MAG: type II secretion system protein [Pseudomonadota bacterium]
MQTKRPARQAPGAYAVRGFTLIELIMVIVMLGILAVYAAPRMFSSNDVYERGFHDQTMAYLRYAQKTAIAQRRTVCVNFASSSSLSLSIALNPATSDCTTAGALTGPEGTATLSAKPGSPVAYSTTPALVNFNFNGLGQPITSTGTPQATQTIRVVGVNRTITIESATGYVHE